jgi:hypothetical protein
MRLRSNRRNDQCRNPPLIHSGKTNSHYGNNKSSYRALIDLCTRARHESYIAYKVIDDPTRPVTVWEVHRGLQSYYERQIEDPFRDKGVGFGRIVQLPLEKICRNSPTAEA